MMDVRDDEVASVLTEALTGYLKILALEQDLLESAQPRQGKGVESNIDVARREYFQSRTTTTQHCLRLVPKIVGSVINLTTAGTTTNETLGARSNIEAGEKGDFANRFSQLNTVWARDDEPYLNPFSGQWITPEGNGKAAGPSGTYELPVEVEQVLELAEELDVKEERSASPSWHSSQSHTSSYYRHPSFSADLYPAFNGTVCSQEPLAAEKGKDKDSSYLALTPSSIAVEVPPQSRKGDGKTKAKKNTEAYAPSPIESRTPSLDYEEALLLKPSMPEVQIYHNGVLGSASWDTSYSTGRRAKVERAEQMLEPDAPAYRGGQLGKPTRNTVYPAVDASKFQTIWGNSVAPHAGGQLKEPHYNIGYPVKVAEIRGDATDQFGIGVAVFTPEHEKSSKGTSAENQPFTTPSSKSSLNLNETSMKSMKFSFDFDNERTAASELQAEWAVENDIFTDTLKFAFDLDDATAISQFHFDHIEAQRLQERFDRGGRSESNDHVSDRDNRELIKQNNYAREVLENEERQAREIEQALEEARGLSAQWESQDAIMEQNITSLQEAWRMEDTQLEEQANFAKEAMRAEEARMAAIRRDMAAAQATHSQWEQEARELLEQNQRLAEQLERAEQAERQRIAAEKAEAEKQARIQRERLAREEAERLRRNEQLRREREEAERRARQADCVSCMETGEKANMCILTCKHAYCGECITGAFNSGSQSRKPFKCCGITAPVSLAERWLPAPFIGAYELLVLELTTPNPKYCSNRSCHRFIPPQNIHGPVASCPSCHTRSCSSCGLAEHAGVCAEDKAGMAVLAMAKREKWKACPRCNAITEKTSGCLHMTCRCGTQFCYSCGRDWGNCGSTCPRR